MRGQAIHVGAFSVLDNSIKLLSTHLARDKKKGSQWLESYLEDWAVWHLTPDIALCSPTKTSLKVAEELRPDRLKTAPPRKGKMYTNNKGEPLSLKMRSYIYELLSMWKKGQQKSDHSMVNRTPNYMPHHRMSKLNKIINQMHDEQPMLWAVIQMRYIDGWTGQRAEDAIGLPKRRFYKRLTKAKAYIKKYLN